MLLAIDTATRWTGLALHNGEQLVAEHGWQSVNTQTVELAPAVVEMLERADATAQDLTAIAVALGPGSYTGLRIGLGFAKGLALAHQVPLVGVPTLDIVAAAHGQVEGELVVVAEAGRRRITSARYGWQGREGWQPLEEPVNETWETLLKRITVPSLVTGEVSEKAARLVRTPGRGLRLAPAAARTRRAGYLAEIAWRRLRKGRADDAAELTPLYLREP